MLIISAIRKDRQENHEFKASMGYIAGSRTVWAMRLCLKESKD
jgi:hypothetical protein